MRWRWVWGMTLVSACLERTPGYDDDGSGGSGGATDGGGATTDGAATDDSATDGSATGGGAGGSTGTSATDGGASSTGATTAPETSTTEDASTTGPGTDTETSATGNTGTTGMSTSSDNPTSTTTGTTMPVVHRAFATATDWESNLGGLGGADLFCNGSAFAAGLGGTFRALLSDSNNDARDRLTITAPIVNMAGETVAVDAADLWDGTISATIDIDEDGNTLPPAALAWTGSNPDGTVAAHCDDWALGGSSGNGTVGDLTDLADEWLSDNDSRCDRRRHLYCVEQ